ncbi:MAG: DUF1826 domain-containing protein [Roseibium sp.]
MNLAGEPVVPVVAADVFMSRDADILDEIGSPGVALAIWQRSPEKVFQDWINQLNKNDLPELRTVVPVHLVEAAVAAACETVSLAPCAQRDVLASDVAALSQIMAKVLDIRQVRIRLDVADEVMCPKFHIDNVPARLLCTYRGKGTDYVPAGFEDEPKRIRQLKPGAVVLFRGALWNSEEATGIKHRSPAVAPEEGSRLLLVIDPVA